MSEKILKNTKKNTIKKKILVKRVVQKNVATAHNVKFAQ